MIETLSILIHADSKVGKTTLAATAPPPILILDAEGGSKFLPLRKVVWDPLREAPPAYDGTWDAAVVTVRDFQTLDLARQWLETGQHNFRSLVYDSISEGQRRLKTNLVGTEQMKMQDWGSLLTLMDFNIRSFRDMTLHPTNPIQVAVFIAETREKAGKWKPYMQGQIEVALPYWMDVIGYLYVENTYDANGQPLNQERRLLVTPHPQFEAGERVQGRIGPVEANPNLTEMLIRIYPQLAIPAAPVAALTNGGVAALPATTQEVTTA